MIRQTLFDMKKITTPLLLHMLGKELRFPLLFLLRCRLTLNRFKKTIDSGFARELVDLAALPAWVYLNLRDKLGQRKAFEIMRVALLTGGTAAQNLRFNTVSKERTFHNFVEMEIENNRSGLVRWNDMRVVERTDRRLELKVTRCMFHEFAVHLGAPEMTPVVCQIDNAMFNSYLPEEMTFSRGGVGRRISDGHHECNFIWNFHPAAMPAEASVPTAHRKKMDA